MHHYAPPPRREVEAPGLPPLMTEVMLRRREHSLPSQSLHCGCKWRERLERHTQTDSYSNGARYESLVSTGGGLHRGQQVEQYNGNHLSGGRQPSNNHRTNRNTRLQAIGLVDLGATVDGTYKLYGVD
jgi:hypothetical protein